MEIRVGLVVLFYILLLSVVIVIYKILFEKEKRSKLDNFDYIVFFVFLLAGLFAVGIISTCF